MEKKTVLKQAAGGRVMDFIKALLCAYVVTGILLLILALLLYKAGLSEENVNAGILLTYVISTFSGGFVIGKLTGSRKFLWGLLAGILYFVLLLLISLGIYHSLHGASVETAAAFVLCAGGGMLGGMIS
ncbi:MAG TPA: TIGR04086 family membrane protein [Candidatus Mediterraneibacter quadrami]|uniref:TIGR04086 family membrane protein n=1 Tax=Candidatus Mediterraneibacter quadrami TaxID=2838684 RepID=A0A9D2RD41_9FIRM|nr:TIGR04086 family membrane protein [Candidatus Mediterraneibacter quadrami]